MSLIIIRNDITKVRADAIVNTANPLPCIGAGTDQAIHEAAGPELLEARKAIGDIAPGQSVETPAFGLPAKYVLHTVSPCWAGGTRHEEDLLRQAYTSALKKAAQLGCATVAFPLMAAGSYGFPHETALSVAIGAITDFLLEHDDMTVYLVILNGKAFGLASSLFDDLKSYIDDNYEDPHSRYDAFASRRKFSMRRDSSMLADAAMCGAAEKAREEVFSAADHAPMETSGADPYGASEPTFSEYLMGLLSERDGKDSEVYKRAEVSKQLFSKILSSKEYQPSKSTAIQLAIGLQLDVNQTQKLLATAGYVLTRSSKADLVVQYYIERKVYSVTFINEALSDCGLPLLKTGLKS